MATRKNRLPFDVPGELLARFDHCCRVTTLLVGAIPVRIWRSAPPTGRGRTIAEIVSHMHSLRRTFAKMGGGVKRGEPIDRLTSTPAQAVRELRLSHASMLAVFTKAFAEERARVKGLPRRVVDMLTYLMQHDAHHRGQITMLAKDLGFELPDRVTSRMWGWRRL
jgi:uncharacterized damage-inducible protein DinB